MKARFAVSCIRIQLDLSTFENLFSNAARIKAMEVKSKFNSKTFSPLQPEVFPAGLQVCHSKRKWSLPHWCRRRRHHWFEPIRWFAVAEWWVASCLLQHTISVFCHGSRDAVLSPHPHSKFEDHPWGGKVGKPRFETVDFMWFLFEFSYFEIRFEPCRFVAFNLTMLDGLPAKQVIQFNAFVSCNCSFILGALTTDPKVNMLLKLWPITIWRRIGNWRLSLLVDQRHATRLTIFRTIVNDVSISVEKFPECIRAYGYHLHFLKISAFLWDLARLLQSLIQTWFREHTSTIFENLGA